MGGSVVEIYARGYTIIGCNDSTLRFVRANMNWTEDEMKQGDWPEDEFIKKNREKMMRETGAVGVNRNRKMHEMKEYMEALLGKPTAMSDLGSFLEVRRQRGKRRGTRRRAKLAALEGHIVPCTDLRPLAPLFAVGQ